MAQTWTWDGWCGQGATPWTFDGWPGRGDPWTFDGYFSTRPLAADATAAVVARGDLLIPKALVGAPFDVTALLGQLTTKINLMAGPTDPTVATANLTTHIHVDVDAQIRSKMTGKLKTKRAGNSQTSEYLYPFWSAPTLPAPGRTGYLLPEEHA